MYFTQKKIEFMMLSDAQEELRMRADRIKLSNFRVFKF